MKLGKQARRVVLASLVVSGPALVFAQPGLAVDRYLSGSQAPSSPAPSGGLGSRDEDIGDQGNDQSGVVEFPESVVVKQLSYAGSGCAAGTVRGSLPLDPSGLLLAYDEFSAEAGRHIPLGNARRNCQVLLDLDYPEGWQYTVQAIGFGGHAYLAEGTTGVAEAAYYFQGQEATPRVETPLTGPLDEAFVGGSDLSDDAQVWSLCDVKRALNVNVAVRILDAASGAEGRVDFGSGGEDGNGGVSLSLKWRRCE